MHTFRVIRTFVAGAIIFGLGHMLAGRLRIAIGIAALYFGSVLFFSWTGLVLNPYGYYTLIAVTFVLLCTSAIHSTWLVSRRSTPATNPYNRWWAYALFALGYIGIGQLIFANRAETLGYEPFRIPASSMAPTLISGDYILVDARYYDDNELSFGDLVVFEDTRNPAVSFTKRVIGLPGDSIELRNGVLFRNGTPVAEPYLKDTGAELGPRRDIRSTKIEPGYFFVLGDNRDNSMDSRFFGPVPISNISGRVNHLWFSWNEDHEIRWGRFPTVYD